MPDQASITIVDYDGQDGIVGLNCQVLTAANFDAQNTALVDLRTAIGDIIDGLVASSRITHLQTLLSSAARATDPNAQRGNKWMVHAHDATLNLGAGVPNPYYLKPFHYEIPTADLELRVDNKNEVWVEGGANNVADFDDFVTAFEAFAKSPVGGSLQIDSIEAVTSSGG